MATRDGSGAKPPAKAKPAAAPKMPPAKAAHADTAMKHSQKAAKLRAEAEHHTRMANFHYGQMNDGKGPPSPYC